MELDENQQENEAVYPFASHFGTNYTPTDDEFVEIHNLLVEPSARITDLEVEMAQKAAEYDAIVEKHARLKRLVADYRALASPMRRLPIDLLREVFYHCLPTEHNATLSYKEAPAVLTQVCSKWRAVALATPALWASLHIPVPQPFSKNLRRVTALTAEDVPALEELVINMTSYYGVSQLADSHPFPPMVTWAKSSFLSAPRLHRVSFSNLGENINTLPIHWQQLTYISLTGVSVGSENMSLASISTLLRKCPRLISARLEIAPHEPLPYAHLLHGYPGVVAESSQSIYRSPILLSNLIDLSLKNPGLDLSSFFTMLDIPRLTTLKYHTNAMAESASELIALVRRISETLVDFTTNAAMFSQEDFFSILKAARRLKKLSNMRGDTTEPPYSWGHHEHAQGFPHFDDVFLGMLVGRQLGQANLNAEKDAKFEEGKMQGVEDVANGYSQVLLPELESFESRIPVNFSDEGLLECLNLRQNPVHDSNEFTANSNIFDAEAKIKLTYSVPYTQFKHFSAAFSRLETRPMSDEISSFIEAGLALHLSYPPMRMSNYFSLAEGIVDKTASTFDRFDPW